MSFTKVFDESFLSSHVPQVVGTKDGTDFKELSINHVYFLGHKVSSKGGSKKNGKGLCRRSLTRKQVDESLGLGSFGFGFY